MRYSFADRKLIGDLYQFKVDRRLILPSTVLSMIQMEGREYPGYRLISTKCQEIVAASRHWRECICMPYLVLSIGNKV